MLGFPTPETLSFGGVSWRAGHWLPFTTTTTLSSMSRESLSVLSVVSRSL